jgi:hypothetical protein
MADREATSSPFDRVPRPDSHRAQERDRQGKEALYSTAPGSRRSSPIEVHCQRCDAQVGLSAGEALRLLRPPWFANPLSRCVWTRCPACSRRSWLGVAAGPSLRLLLQRPPSD